MRVVFMGTPDFSVPTLEKIIEAGHEVIGVVTQPDKAKGRGKKGDVPAGERKSIGTSSDGLSAKTGQGAGVY